MRPMWVWMWMAGCGSAGSVTDTETGSSAGTPTGDTAPACAIVTSGDDWAWSGQCPGMQTPCTVEVDGCDLTVDYGGGMDMGMPTRGTIEGDEVTFHGGAVRGCVGTVLTRRRIEGTCDGGCTFALER